MTPAPARGKIQVCAGIDVLVGVCLGEYGGAGDHIVYGELAGVEGRADEPGGGVTE